MSAAISIVDEAEKDLPDWQKVGQTLADISAMLGHASAVVSQTRRLNIKNLLKEEYKPLCDNEGSHNYLFGDELPKQIMELNLTNKIAAPRFEAPRSRRGYRPYKRPYRSPGHFLARGRGNLPERGNRGRPNRRPYMRY